MSRCNKLGFGLLLLVSAWSVLLLQKPVQAQQKKAHTLDDIEKAWKARQSKIQGLWIKWKDTRHFPRGFYSAQQRLREPEFAEKYIPKGAILPSRDTEVQFVSSLTFDGRRVRYHTGNAMWDLGKSAYVVVPKICVFDGDKDIFLSRETSEFKPVGILHRPLAVLVPKGPHLGPILRHIRPFDLTWSGIDLKKHTVTPRPLLIDGAWCIELEMQTAGASALYRRYLDPQKGYALTRTVVLTKGKVTSQQDIQYAPDPILGWMPTSWIWVGNHVDGKTLNTERGTVLTYSVNPTIPDSQFSLAFPAGTMVSDQLIRDRYQLAGTPNPEGFPALLGTDIDAADPFAGESISESPVSGWTIWHGLGLVLTCLVIALAAYSLYRIMSLKRRSS